MNRKASSFLAISVLGIISWFANVSAVGQNRHSERSYQTLDEYSQFRANHLSGAIEILSKEGVRFRPDILLQPHWRYSLEPALAAIPQTRTSLSPEQPLRGVVMANELLIPE